MLPALANAALRPNESKAHYRHSGLDKYLESFKRAQGKPSHLLSMGIIQQAMQCSNSNNNALQPNKWP
eukprot:scaffold184871_cov16-Prasinocladus_malaysianus.AAC.1